jgi:hypothetical protein
MNKEEPVVATLKPSLWGVAALVIGLAAPTLAQAASEGAGAGVVLAGEVTEAAAAPAPLTDDTVATAPKPKGFRYSILRNVLIDEVGSTRLYVKKSKKSKTTTAVPIPKDRGLLASCIKGGQVDDLQRGATATVRFDPRGVVRPFITVIETSKLEVMSQAKVLDIAGTTLYIIYGEGYKEKRGFKIEGTYKDWDHVVTNGTGPDLKAGMRIRVTHDPSGRQPLQVTLLDPPSKDAKAAAGKKGCGCDIRGQAPAGTTAVSAVLLFLCLAMVLRRRQSDCRGMIEAADGEPDDRIAARS